MSSTFSALKFELIATGEQSGAWGSTTNTNIGTAIEQAIVGMATLTSADFSSNVGTLTLANANTAQNARALCLVISASSLSAAGTLNVPAIQKPYLIINNDSYAVTVKVSGLTGVSVPAGKRTVVYNNGTDVGNQIDYLSSLTLGTALPIASGGTGQTTAAAAITALTGTQTSGQYLRSNGTNAVMSAIQAADVPVLNQNTTGTAAGLSSTLAISSGGTGATSRQDAMDALAGAVTSGQYLRGNGTDVVMSAIQAADVPVLNQNTTGTAAGLSSTLATTSGGTGQTTYTDGQLLIGNSTGNTLTKATLTAGSNVTITNSAGGITIASSNSGGTVTSVSGTSPVSVANGTTTPTVSLAASYGDTQNPYAAKTAAYVLAGPTSGAAAVPSFRALATTDIPTLNQNTTGTAAGLSATLATTSGGTGLTSFTANGVMYASSTSGLSTGAVLTFNGTSLGVIGDTAASTRKFTVGTSYNWPSTTFAVVDFGIGSLYEQNAQDVTLSANVRYSSIFQTVYKAAAAASQYKQVGGAHYWSSNTTVGSVGANLTLTDQMTLNDSGLSVAKGIITRVNSQTTTTSPWAWDSTLYDQQQFTALANALTINADAGTPANGQQTIFRFTDNGTAQALTWTTGTSKSFRALGTPLPTTTVASKTLYVGCVYNSTADRWDVLAVAQET